MAHYHFCILDTNYLKLLLDPSYFNRWQKLSDICVHCMNLHLTPMGMNINETCHWLLIRAAVTGACCCCVYYFEKHERIGAINFSQDERREGQSIEQQQQFHDRSTLTTRQSIERSRLDRLWSRDVCSRRFVFYQGRWICLFIFFT